MYSNAATKKARSGKRVEERKQKHKDEIQSLFQKVTIPDMQSSSTSESEDSDVFYAPPRKIPHQKETPASPASSKINLDANLTSWDRENLSVRQASASFIAAAKTLGVEPSKIAVSPSTVHRTRTKNREIIAKQLESEAFTNPPSLVLHWDGKLLPQASSKWDMEDQIAIVATGVEFEEILGIPTAKTGTGDEVTKTVLRETERLKLKEKIIGLSFDTTAANSGLVKGACIRIEKDLDRPLLWLACRHHIHEMKVVAGLLLDLKLLFLKNCRTNGKLWT